VPEALVDNLDLSMDTACRYFKHLVSDTGAGGRGPLPFRDGDR